jgi:hypothetical protein
VIGAGVLIYTVERQGDGPIQTLPDALWWAASTITTVGYGDVYPRTAAGRGIAVVLMLVGISLFGVLTARVAAFFVQDEQRDAEADKLDTSVCDYGTLRSYLSGSALLALTNASWCHRCGVARDRATPPVARALASSAGTRR